MKKKDPPEKYAWKDRYDHVYSAYCGHFNHAIYYIAQNYGIDAMEKYLKECMGKDVVGKATFSDLKEGKVDTEAFLKSYIPHHEMIGGEVKLVKADQDGIIVDLIKCGSKSMLVEKWGELAKYYCRHCEIIPLWEQMGWYSEVDKTNAQTLRGQNIGCRRIFRRIKK